MRSNPEPASAGFFMRVSRTRAVLAIFCDRSIDNNKKVLFYAG